MYTAVTISLGRRMEKFVHKLRQDFPDFRFISGDAPQWSPHVRQITYVDEDTSMALYGVLHELGHALLGHKTYDSDAVLIQKEASAWSKAVAVATMYGVQIEEEHIQLCLDTYRDWLHKRSTCPQCQSHGVQLDNIYRCLNCAAHWRVTTARFCRTYRTLTN